MTNQELIAIIKEEGFHDQFEHEDLPCIINRNVLGCWCAYVGVPSDHPFYRKKIMDKFYVKASFMDQEFKPNKVGALNFLLTAIDPKVMWDLKGKNSFIEMPMAMLIDTHHGIAFSGSKMFKIRAKPFPVLGTPKPQPAIPTSLIDVLQTTAEKLKIEKFDWFIGCEMMQLGDLIPAIGLVLPRDIYKTKEYAKAQARGIASQLHTILPFLKKENELAISNEQKQ